MDVTTETFEDEVVARSAERPVIVDFWAEWCGPCRALGPVLEREVGKRAGEVELAKVDTEANPELAERFGIQGIPAVKAFRNGHVVGEFVGALPPAAVAQFLDEVTGPSPAQRLLAELRETGEAPEVADALEQSDYELALSLLLRAVEDAEPERRGRLRELMVTLFSELGQDHPLSVSYRRRLATALY